MSARDLLLVVLLALASTTLAQPTDVTPTEPVVEGQPALRGTDVLEDQDARLRSGVDAEELPIGTRCTTPGAELEIAGVGRAVYDRISVDTAAGSARLSGGVCIEVPEVDLVIRALFFEVTGLDGSALGEGASPRIAALQAVVDMGGWRLAVASLQGPIENLDLRNIRLTAPGLAGVAASGRIQGGDPFEASLEEVALATRRYRLDALHARLRGDELLLQEAGGTTCVCEVERFRLQGATVRANLTTGDVTVREPHLRVLGVSIPLGHEISLGGDGPQLEFPVGFAGHDELGSIAVLRGSMEGGPRIEFGAGTEPMIAPLAHLDVEEEGDRVRFEADARGLLLDVRRERPILEGAFVAAFSETVLREDDPSMRAGAEAGWTGRRQDELGGGVSAASTLSLRAGAEVAAEPDAVLPAEPAGVPTRPAPAALRLPFAVDARTNLSLTPIVRLDLRGRIAAAVYPTAAEFGRAALTLSPILTIGGSDARATLSLDRRWAVGDGPFEFDAVAPRFRIVADAALDLGPVAADARVAWRLPPERAGAEDLRLHADLDLPLAGGWSLRPALRTELAGIAGGPADEDWIEAELALASGEDTRYALRAREGLDPPALRDLTLSAQMPFDVQDVRLVPYLAVDVAPLFDGGGPQLAGHGLRLYVDDCCGTVILGYRMNEGEWTFEVDMRLPPLDLAEPPLGADVLPASVLEALPGEPPPAPAAPGGGRGPGGPVPLDPRDALDGPEGSVPEEESPPADPANEPAPSDPDTSSILAPGEARYGGAS